MPKNALNVANYLKLYSGNAPATSRPQLIIEYCFPQDQYIFPKEPRTMKCPWLFCFGYLGKHNVRLLALTLSHAFGRGKDWGKCPEGGMVEGDLRLTN
jgi:hypothetical protein